MVRILYKPITHILSNYGDVRLDRYFNASFQYSFSPDVERAIT